MQLIRILTTSLVSSRLLPETVVSQSKSQRWGRLVFLEMYFALA